MFKVSCLKFKVLFCFCLCITQGIYAADSLKITINQADSLFLKNNYQLLAASMEVSAQNAMIIQAKLYPNPIFSASFNAYNPGTKEYFKVGSNGEKGYQISQLILLGGKRQAQIDMAKTNAKMAELAFADVVRTLKFQLHSSLYALHQYAGMLDKYTKQLVLLDTIIRAYEVQAKKGNIPAKDVVRLKGVYLNLNNQRGELLKQYYDETAKVQTILQTSQFISPQIKDTTYNSFNKEFIVDFLVETALQNRPDYLMLSQNATLAGQFLNYQKKLAIPDINLMATYDQRGSAFPNEYDLGFGIPLPLWNRNQGNIKFARYKTKEAQLTQSSLKTSIESEVRSNYALYTTTLTQYKKAESLYNSDFETTLKGMSDNFQKRNVSLIEFVDFFEAYNDAMAEISRLKIQIAQSAEQLNYTTVKQLF
ncbi:MAG: TolC family protein [Bacteroidetes bacterium]|nr:TolC family protein [Bacteroidota bacterium]